MTKPTLPHGEQAYEIPSHADAVDDGHGTGDVNDAPKMGDYSGRGAAGGIRGVGGGFDRPESEYREGGDEYRGEGGQSGVQAGGPSPAGHADQEDASAPDPVTAKPDATTKP